MFNEENLAMRSGVTITAAVTSIKGSGASDPCILLNEKAHHLDEQNLSEFVPSNTYDTYDGQNTADSLDWYAIQFPEEVIFNWIEMTMGFAYPDGGWWTSLYVQIKHTPNSSWEHIHSVSITPSYDFSDGRGRRRPFETYILTFSSITACAIRLVGTPGGSAQFTSLARIAVRHRDVAFWNPIPVFEPPYPYILRLISPQLIWDMSENFTKLTKIVINFPLMDYYLDNIRYEKLLKRIHHNYQGQPELWFLVGDSVGWTNWWGINSDGIAHSTTSNTADHTLPYIRLSFHQTLGSIAAPIMVDDKILGVLSSSPVLIKDYFDITWHQQFAQAHHISWDIYLAAIDRSPQMTLEQLEGAAGLMGMITNTIANLVHLNLRMKHVLSGEHGSDVTRRLQEQAVQRAIEYMRQDLEKPITIAEVASKVGFSIPYFCTLFADYMGINPGDYIINLRLERAKEYLTHTNLSIKDVSSLLGYNPSYFSRLFKKRVGMGPAQYAAKMRQA
jgi:AraC-like DNA-binding protein